MIIPAPRLKFYRLVNSLKPLADGSPAGAERLVKAMLHRWQLACYPHLASTRIPYGSSSLLGEKAVRDFSGWLSEQPFNEAAYWLATSYAILVGDKLRTERALYFTPPRMADRVIDDLLRHGASLTKHHWHDPACGGAAFLVPIAQRMAAALTDSGMTAKRQIDHISRNLSGNDLDRALLDISSEFLRMALSHLIAEANCELQPRLLHGDGLTSSEMNALRPDVVACNPPYRKLKSKEVDRYRETHGDVVQGQPNVYGLFMNRTLQLAQHDGLIGLLTPTSFLSGKSFSKLRTKLLTYADTLQVDMLSDRSAIFINVEQETAITVLRCRTPGNVIQLRTHVNVLKGDGEFEDLGAFLLPNSGCPWPIPRAANDVELIQSANSAGFSLTDYGYVARVGHLVGYRDKRPRFVQYPTTKKNRLVLPLVWATDISSSGQFVHGRDCRYGRDRRFVQVSELNDHGVITKPAVLLQRLTSNDQKRRLIAAAVPQAWVEQFGGFICENHVIILEPLSRAAVSPSQLAAVLNSQPVDRVFRAISGATNVAVSELNELLLPNPAQINDLTLTAPAADFDEVVRMAYRAPT